MIDTWTSYVDTPGAEKSVSMHLITYQFKDKYTVPTEIENFSDYIQRENQYSNLA